ncbi:ribosome biogenesis ATPase [Nematocida displodere]|uniref:Ribosome biogenesis ATPase n=1 Tax=Nematocida displodere TaxID=1805483 RepID=A0A177EBT4_9MICR|nr:ribosome biogenesis ATPase [Nematocida displodere]
MVDYNKRLRESYMQNRETGEREKMLSQNKHSFEHLGGIASQKKEIVDCIKLPLEFAKYYEFLGVVSSTGILVHGPGGSGKTSFVFGAGKECSLPVVSFTRSDFVLRGSAVEDNATALLQKAAAVSPSIAFIDGIDSFCRKRDSLDNETDKRVVTRVIDFIDNLPKGVILIATATTPDDIDPSLRRSGRLDKEVKLFVPTEPDRQEILQKLFREVKHADLDFLTMTKNTPGYVGADLKALVTESGHIAVKRALTAAGKIGRELNAPYSGVLVPLELMQITTSDVEEALRKIQPSARKEGFIVIPDTNFEDIGALHEVKSILEMAIINPSLFPERFARVGIKKPAGVLLYGPPGTGKTMLARAIASRSHCNFISVKGPEIINMYYGESERSIRNLFARARASQPCVIFFDEIDSICGRRGNGTNRYSDTLVNQLLVEMDGLEERGAVYLIGATNRLDIIDRALLRPGRFDNVIEVKPPTNEGLVEILAKKLAKVCVDVTVNPQDLPLQGLTGAEVDLLVREAGSICLREGMTQPNPSISQTHLIQALALVLAKKESLVGSTAAPEQ